jgi:hypothetical protein
MLKFGESYASVTPPTRNNEPIMTNNELAELLGEAKHLARRYYALTGKPLGITGEIAEWEAAVRLNLDLAGPRQAGYDATETRDGQTRQLQIKGRCIRKTTRGGERIGRIDINKQFDAVLLVLLDENFEATMIREASRVEVIDAITKPGSKARNEKGALSIANFKKMGSIRWQR